MKAELAAGEQALARLESAIGPCVIAGGRLEQLAAVLRMRETAEAMRL